MVPFYGWGSTASRLQPLRGGSLLSNKRNSIFSRKTNLELYEFMPPKLSQKKMVILSLGMSKKTHIFTKVKK